MKLHSCKFGVNEKKIRCRRKSSPAKNIRRSLLVHPCCWHSSTVSLTVAQETLLHITCKPRNFYYWFPTYSSVQKWYMKDIRNCWVPVNAIHRPVALLIPFWTYSFCLPQAAMERRFLKYLLCAQRITLMFLNDFLQLLLNTPCSHIVIEQVYIQIIH